MFEEDEEEEGKISVEEENPFRQSVMGSVYPSSIAFGDNQAFSEWFDSSSFCLAAGESLLISFWDRVPSNILLDVNFY